MMVSFENGKFILRKRDDGPRFGSRRSKLRRVIVTALVFSSFYLISHGMRSRREEPDFSLLRAAHRANVGSHAISRHGRDASHSSSRDDDDDVDDDHKVQNATDSHHGDEGSPDRGERRSDRCKISLDDEYLEYLRSLEPIPKKVHIFFPDKNYWRKEPPIPFVEHSILSLKRLNPDWDVTVYDDEMVDEVIRRAAISNLITQEECDDLVGKKDDEGNVVEEAGHIVERSDVARLLLMYVEGGFYVDADRLVSRRMEDVVPPNARMCLPTSNDANFCQDLMCSAPRNDLFLSIVRAASAFRLPLERRKGWIKGGALFDLGPVLYNRQILIRVFGGDDETYDKCIDDFPAAREMISAGSNGIIVTKKETDCNDGLLVDDTLPLCHDRQQLYDMYGMKQWDVQVDARWADNKEG